jgi:hypothetical protein
MLHGVQKAMNVLHAMAENPLDMYNTTEVEPYFTLLNSMSSSGTSSSGHASSDSTHTAQALSIPVITLPTKKSS